MTTILALIILPALIPVYAVITLLHVLATLAGAFQEGVRV